LGSVPKEKRGTGGGTGAGRVSVDLWPSETQTNETPKKRGGEKCKKKKNHQ